LLDPLHMITRFSSVPMDREDRHQRVSANLVCLFPVSISGYSPSGSTGTGN
jgi:hypothetical protein